MIFRVQHCETGYVLLYSLAVKNTYDLYLDVYARKRTNEVKTEKE